MGGGHRMLPGEVASKEVGFLNGLGIISWVLLVSPEAES